MWTSTLPKVIVSSTSVVLLMFFGLQGVAVSTGQALLAVLAVLPWLAPVIDSMNLPGGMSVKFREVQHKVNEQQSQIRQQQEIINQLVVYSMSFYLYRLLSELYHRRRDGREYLYTGDEAMKHDLRYLRDHGFIEHFQVHELPAGSDLPKTVQLTPVGNFFVEIREKAIGSGGMVT